MSEVEINQSVLDQAIEKDDKNTEEETPVKDVKSNTISSYINQWKTYFLNGDGGSRELLGKLRVKAYKESLRSCHFRSVCWRVFLSCLPEDVNDWKNALSNSRDHYAKIRSKHITNPQSLSADGNVQLENPLSQNDRSAWSHYFKNNELKDMIDRDVKRTCPEMDFFHKEKVREILGNVLFSYACEHETLSYRQGMHELLGPIVFVIHCDQQGAAHAKDIGCLPDLISIVLNEDYLEHDAYTMFCQVMDATNAWYAVSAPSKPKSPCSDDSKDIPEKLPFSTVPFQPVENNINGPPLEITNKLNHIHNTLLAYYDKSLYCHLNHLEIIPQVYGLRWIRLLFGREFDLQDLLVLWDALFADSKTLDLVDYIFVAMMHNIRHELLASDYCKCMQLLMKYPPIDDIYDLLHLALHYRDPKNKAKPPQHRFRTHENLVKSASLQTKVTEKKNKINFLQNIKIENPFGKIKMGFQSSIKPKKSSQSGESSSTDEKLKELVKVEDMVAVKQRTTSRTHSLSNVDAIRMKGNESFHRQETELLKRRLEYLQEMCEFCSKKLDIDIQLLQQVLTEDFVRTSSSEGSLSEIKSCDDPEVPTTLNRSEISLVALANIKQVRDILQGTLNFAGASSFSSHSLSTATIDTLHSELDQLPTPPDDAPEFSESNKHEDSSEKDKNLNVVTARSESWTVVEDTDCLKE